MLKRIYQTETFTRETVTPQVAFEYLKANTRNRKPKARLLKRYAADMVSKRWLYNPGCPITFDWYGRLQNGQHRLLAVVETGLAQDFMVVRGSDPDNFQTTDRGGGERKITDLADIAGYGKNSRAFGRVGRAMLAGTKAIPSNMFDADDRALELIGQHSGLMDTICSALSSKPDGVRAAFVDAVRQGQYSLDDVLKAAKDFKGRNFTKGASEPINRLDFWINNTDGFKMHEAYNVAAQAVVAQIAGQKIAKLQVDPELDSYDDVKAKVQRRNEKLAAKTSDSFRMVKRTVIRRAT